MKKFLTAIFIISTIASFAQKSSIFQTNEGSLKGYDVVAFYKDSAAIKGNTAFSYSWQNATWYFKNAENLEAFKTNPEQYAPQYGGYCAYGVSDNHKAPTEANTFTIINGKLYFNYNQKVKTYWQKNTDQRIAKANELWPTIKDKE
jgi:YHS domain-containing protein